MAKYTVAVRPAGDTSILVSWRSWGWYSRRNFTAENIPYTLAIYCLLIPNAAQTGFTEHLYQLSAEELAEVKTTKDQKVTRRGGLTYFTFTLRETGNCIQYGDLA